MALTQKEEIILSKIYIASENDPNNPEFPPGNPKFPATPIMPIIVPEFDNVWLKDESKNPTGTHKDRMAWEIIVSYRTILLNKKKDLINSPLPSMSIISSGSAAIAIQTALKKYGLPNLKVLIDINCSKTIVDSLNRIGCEIYKTNLTTKKLGWKEILDLTENKNGFDITSNRALNPNTRFYDWLSYEIINCSPHYCFIPFGTGNLYENILNIVKKEVDGIGKADPRFRGESDILRRCNFIGATTNNVNSIAEKLYSSHLPFAEYDEQWIKFYKYSGFCGKNSSVKILEEKYLKLAMKIAKDNNIDCEPSGIAGLGIMLQMKNDLPKDKMMLIVNTGKCKYC